MCGHLTEGYRPRWLDHWHDVIVLLTFDRTEIKDKQPDQTLQSVRYTKQACNRFIFFKWMFSLSFSLSHCLKLGCKFGGRLQLCGQPIWPYVDCYDVKYPASYLWYLWTNNIFYKSFLIKLKLNVKSISLCSLVSDNVCILFCWPVGTLYKHTHTHSHTHSKINLQFCLHACCFQIFSHYGCLNVEQ